MPGYMRVPITFPSSPSHSSSLAAFVADIAMMVEEIFGQSIVREYILPSPDNKIPLSTYRSYNLVT